MKRKLTILIILFIPVIFVQSQIQWYSIEEAQELVRNDPKKVLTFIYADWCDHCEKMQNTTLKNHEIIEYINANFYPVKLNAEYEEPIIFKGRKYINPEPGKHKSWHRLALSLAVFDKAIGFPTLVFFDENFNMLIDQTRGYKSVEKLEMYIRYITDEEYKFMTLEEYEGTYTSLFSLSQNKEQATEEACNDGI